MAKDGILLICMYFSLLLELSALSATFSEHIQYFAICIGLRIAILFLKESVQNHIHSDAIKYSMATEKPQQF